MRVAVAIGIVGTLVCVACGDDDPSPGSSGAAFVGDQGPGGGTGAGASSGRKNDAGTDDGGTDGGVTDEGCAPPRGNYDRMLGELSGECGAFSNLFAPTVVFSSDHTYTSTAAAGFGSCTVTATTFSSDGCTMEQTSSCTSGRNEMVTCTLSEGGAKLACTTTLTLTPQTCMAAATYKRSSAPNCDEPAGVYRVEVTSAQGDPSQGCMSPNVRELTWNDFLAQQPSTFGCKWSEPQFDSSSCMFSLKALCSSSPISEPSLTCTFEPDGTSGSCQVADGDCAYEIRLER